MNRRVYLEPRVVRSDSSENSSVSSVSRSWESAVRHWELDAVRVESRGVRATAVLGGDIGRLDDLDVRPADTVASGELRVHLLDGTGEAGVPILLVHVVGTGAGVVANPHTKVLHGLWVLLVDLVHGEDLSSGGLYPSELGHKVPEAGTSTHLILGEDLHLVYSWGGISLGGQLAANHLELTHLNTRVSYRCRDGVGSRTVMLFAISTTADHKSPSFQHFFAQI